MKIVKLADPDMCTGCPFMWREENEVMLDKFKCGLQRNKVVMEISSSVVGAERLVGRPTWCGLPATVSAEG